MKLQAIVLLLLLLTSSLSFACTIKSVDNDSSYTLQTKKLITELSKTKDLSCHSKLIKLLKHKNQSIRLFTTSVISKIKFNPQKEIPALIENFDQPNGEEGIEYVEAVASYGVLAESATREALKSNSWLIQERACDTLMKIKETPNMTYKHICK